MFGGKKVYYYLVMARLTDQEKTATEKLVCHIHRS